LTDFYKQSTLSRSGLLVRYFTVHVLLSDFIDSSYTVMSELRFYRLYFATQCSKHTETHANDKQ